MRGYRGQCFQLGRTRTRRHLHVRTASPPLKPHTRPHAHAHAHTPTHTRPRSAKRTMVRKQAQFGGNGKYGQHCGHGRRKYTTARHPSLCLAHSLPLPLSLSLFPTDRKKKSLIVEPATLASQSLINRTRFILWKGRWRLGDWGWETRTRTIHLGRQHL